MGVRARYQRAGRYVNIVRAQSGPWGAPEPSLRRCQWVSQAGSQGSMRVQGR